MEIIVALVLLLVLVSYLFYFSRGSQTDFSNRMDEGSYRDDNISFWGGGGHGQ